MPGKNNLWLNISAKVSKNEKKNTKALLNLFRTISKFREIWIFLISHYNFFCNIEHKGHKLDNLRLNRVDSADLASTSRIKLVLNFDVSSHVLLDTPVATWSLMSWRNIVLGHCLNGRLLVNTWEQLPTCWQLLRICWCPPQVEHLQVQPIPVVTQKFLPASISSS